MMFLQRFLAGSSSSSLLPLHLLFLCHLVLYLQLLQSVSGQDKTVVSILVKLESKFPFSLPPNKTWNPSVNSSFQWNLVGHDDCFVKLTCTKFQLGPNCDKQWLRVTDGYTGNSKYCGGTGPRDVQASKGLRDLYVSLESKGGADAPAALECTATCVKENDNDGGKKFLAWTEMLEKTSAKCQCGLKPLQSRIVGGGHAKKGEHPWLAAMVVAKTRQPYCIGALINDRMVLTGAHCFQGRFRRPNSSELVFNSRLMDPMPNVHLIDGPVTYKTYNESELARVDRGNNSFRYSVEKIIMHPLYNATMSDYDTAVMVLSSPVTHDYTPVCLPPLAKNGKPDLYTDQRGEIVGWGLNEVNATETLAHLRKIRVDVMPGSECVDFYGSKIPHRRRVLCAAHPKFEQDTCTGDSGGPLVVEEKKIWYQVGIISWGEGCGQVGEPGVYYRTTSTNQWIHYQGNLEGASWCLNVEYPYPSSAARQQ